MLKMEKYILVEYLSSLNFVITQTFKSTQRIKLTSFDISDKYIIFGASSGGIYIFKREPCEFIKLIPSKETSVTKILIAPDEKNLAVATAKGLILILENFLDVNLKTFIHSQHENNIITAMKWQGNEVYCGDNIGKISVFSLSSLLTIFQVPSAVIMHLDSSIVQIDIYLNYLLVSTQTRTYLCNTEKEQYKQIGKKLRDGNFGACFFNVKNSTELEGVHKNSRGIFKTIKEEDSFATSINNSDIKIYCARPGARIWEANFEATVLMTYQFRESLAQCPSDIMYITDEANAKLNISTYRDSSKVSTGFNFGKIYAIYNKFILTYDAEGIYFFDPKISRLMFWANSFKNIKDIKVLNSIIYVWQGNLQINIISLSLLEDLIIKTLLNKQYYLCAELCANFDEEVIDLVHKSEKIHLISILKFKLMDIEAASLLDKIQPVLSALEKYNKEKTLGKKLTNGIVLVENVYKSQISEEYDYISVPKPIQNFTTANLNNGRKEIIEAFESVDSSISKGVVDCWPGNTNENGFQESEGEQLKSKQLNDEENPKLLSLYKQYQLNKTHKNVDLTESSTLLEGLNLDDILILFKDFMKYVEALENTDASTWCKEQFLKQASKKDFDITDVDQNIISFLSEAFLELNKSDSYVCKCKFPLPKTHINPLKYYKLGCIIFNKLENTDNCLHTVPYLYKYKLSGINNLNDLLLNLPLMTQFSDKHLFEQFINIFTYDTWDEIIKLFIKLKQGICLNCSEPIDMEGTLTWSDVGMIMVKSIGPQNTSRLLKRYSAHIPKGDLDIRFYQCCILASAFDESYLAVHFMEKIVNENVSQKLEDLMETFLQSKYLGHQSLTITDGDLEVPKCSYCDLPLNEPIINDIKKCDCGHNFHSLCFMSNNGICSVCTTT